MPLVLKVKFEEDTRRITLEQTPSFEALLATVKTLFPNVPSSFIIKYVDEDEDAVTISSDIELTEAIRVAATNNLLRLQLIAKSSIRQAQPEQNKPTQNPLFSFPNLPEILTNPGVGQNWLESLIGQFSQVQTNQSNPKPNDIPDLVSLFQHLGLNSQTMTGSQDTGIQQMLAQQNVQQLIQRLLTSPYIQQLLPQLVLLAPQLLPLLNGFPAFSQNSQTSTATNSDTGKEEQDNVQHYGVVCDICEAPITGVRYKCTTCINYDLCAKCEAKGSHDASHMLLKIQKPLSAQPTGYGRGCPYMRPKNVNNNSEPSRWNSNRGPRRTAQQSGFLSRFVQDVTIPDGSSMNAGQQFVKIWRLRNEGEMAWQEGTYLEFVGGDKLCVHKEISVPAAAPGTEVDIAVDMIAPTKSGRYISYWRLCNADGSRFGQRVWIDIVVQNDVQNQNAKTIPSTQSTQTQQAFGMEVETQTNVATSHKATGTTVVSTTVGTCTDEKQAKQSMGMEVETQTNSPGISHKATGTAVVSTTVGTSTEEKQTKDIAVSHNDPIISQEVQHLCDMGFDNPELLQRLVAKHSGDLVAVVQELLRM